MNGKRLTWVDTAKGWGILAVMVSHVLTGHTLSRWLFTFHVPLFFFMSGFLFRADRPWGDFWKSRVKKLLVPYFALAVPIVAAETALYAGREKFMQWLGPMALGVLVQRRQWPIWFLACLLVMELLAYALCRRIQKPGTLPLAAGAMGVLGILWAKANLPALPWNLDAAFAVMPFFMAGYLMKNSPGLQAYLAAGKNRLWLFAALAAGNILLSAQVILGNVEGLDVFKSQYGIPWLSYPAAFCGIGAVVLASQKLTAGPVRYLGRNSLIYFVWHQTPVITAIYYFFPKWGIPMENYASRLDMLGEKALEMAIILLVLTVCNELLSRSCLKWVLGK